MVEDRSLDEFAASESAKADEGSTTDSEEPTADADPATSTSTWASAGVDCERCGERVNRRWADDGPLVCADCKTW